jgi:hypothetical protein
MCKDRLIGGKRIGSCFSLAAGVGVALAAVLLGAAETPVPERRMDVTQGPDTVFERPVAEILPELEGATPTGENGRVGDELVFWGYRLADGRPTDFYACARVAGVDCTAWAEAICEDGTTVLATGGHSGRIVQRRCGEVGVAHPGETRPGCVDTVADVELAVGLVSCG